HEIFPIGNFTVRKVEVRCVGEVEGFHSKLQFPSLGKGELAEQAEVPVEETRPAQTVESYIPEARLGDFREGCRIIIGIPTPHPSEFFYRRFYLIGGLVASRHIQGGVFGGDGEGRAAQDTDKAVGLPPTQNGRKWSSVAQPAPALPEGQLPDVHNAEVVSAIRTDERSVPGQVRDRLDVGREGTIYIWTDGLRTPGIHCQPEAL